MHKLLKSIALNVIVRVLCILLCFTILSHNGSANEAGEVAANNSLDNFVPIERRTFSFDYGLEGFAAVTGYFLGVSYAFGKSNEDVFNLRYQRLGGNLSGLSGGNESSYFGSWELDFKRYANLSNRFSLLVGAGIILNYLDSAISATPSLSTNYFVGGEFLLEKNNFLNFNGWATFAELGYKSSTLTLKASYPMNPIQGFGGVVGFRAYL